MVQVSIDRGSFERLRKKLGEGTVVAKKALAAALNRTIESMQSRMVRRLAKILPVTAQNLRTGGAAGRYGKIAVVRASPSNLAAGLSISGRRIPLSFFKAKELPGSRIVFTRRVAFTRHTLGGQVRIDTVGRTWLQKTRTSGIKYAIRRSGGTTEITEAFIGRGRRGTARSAADDASGHVAVFKRVSQHSRKLVQLFGPSIGRVLIDEPGVVEETKRESSELMKKNIESQIARFTKGR